MRRRVWIRRWTRSVLSSRSKVRLFLNLSDVEGLESDARSEQSKRGCACSSSWRASATRFFCSRRPSSDRPNPSRATAFFALVIVFPGPIHYIVVVVLALCRYCFPSSLSCTPRTYHHPLYHHHHLFNPVSSTSCTCIPSQSTYGLFAPTFLGLLYPRTLFAVHRSPIFSDGVTTEIEIRTHLWPPHPISITTMRRRYPSHRVQNSHFIALTWGRIFHLKGSHVWR